MLENMLDYVRITLYAVLVALGFLLFQAWEKEHPPESPAPTTQTSTIPQGRFVPETTPASSTAGVPPQITQTAAQVTAPTEPVAPVVSTSQLITVTTDTLEVKIDTRGGDMVEAKLLHYPESLGSKTPFLLLNDDPKSRYLAESGLLSKQGPDTPAEQAIYTSPQTSYTLNPAENTVTVDLNWKNPQGLTVTKTFTFTRNSYEIQVAYAIQNQSQETWTGNMYTQLLRTNTPPPNHGGVINLTTYFGAAVSTPDKPFQKLPFKDMQTKPFAQTAQDGWVAMIQHYFISAWIPPKTEVSNFYSTVTNNGLYTVGMMSQPLTVAPGASLTSSAKLYVGPTIADLLEKTAPHLQLTIDYGWFWFISGIIFWMMQKIYDVVGNWGWSIVLVTIIIKLLFYQLSAKSYRSMSKLKKLQPRIEQLRERFGEDKQKLTQATLELYRQEKVNPMTGCLPILIQIPVFIALYWVLVESVQLRQAPFILWIHDLSQQDPYYILPVLMGISMFIQQRLNPPPPDPLQAKIMMLMPVIFTVLFANFPSGLMLYWFVNNTLSFMQQWFVMKRLDKEGNGHHRK